MKRERFKQIVETLENRLKNQPRWFYVSWVLWLMLWPMVGMIVLAGAIASWVMVGLAPREWEGVWLWSGGVFTVISCIWLWPIYRVLRPRSPLTGVEASRAQSPELWNTINKMSSQIGQVSVDRVFLSFEHNAAAGTDFGRFGISRAKFYLVVGVPMMMSLTEQQFERVIAHELGHLRQRYRWLWRLSDLIRAVLWVSESTRSAINYGSSRPDSLRAKLFFRCEAFNFVSKRHGERAADAHSRDSNLQAASALVTIALRAKQQQKFWEELDKRALAEPEPPPTVMLDMERALQQVPDEAALREFLAEQLAVRTMEYDTHPCLAERLDALGLFAAHGLTLQQVQSDPAHAAAVLPLAQLGHSGVARKMLGSAFSPTIAKFEGEWRAYNSDAWVERHKQYVESQRILSESDARRAAAAAAISTHEDDLSGAIEANINPGVAAPQFTDPTVVGAGNAEPGVVGQQGSIDSDKPRTRTSPPKLPALPPPVITPRQLAKQLLDEVLSSEMLRGPDEALARAKSVLEQHPNDGPLAFTYGRLLLAHKKDDSGIGWLEKAVAADLYMGEAAFDLIASHYTITNRHAAADECRQRLDKHNEFIGLVMARRYTFSTNEVLLPHDETPEDVAKIVEAIGQCKWALRAWLMRRQIQMIPKQPDLVMIVESEHPWWMPVSESSIRKQQKELSEKLPAGCGALFWVVSKAMDGGGVLQVARRQGQYLIFKRDGK